jgi:hypothetical protein
MDKAAGVVFGPALLRDEVRDWIPATGWAMLSMLLPLLRLV